MAVYSDISSGVQISVRVKANLDMSKISKLEFFFNYTVSIENKNIFPIQLLTRHWEIFDSLHPTRIVDGEGVIGVQPIIDPMQSVQYTSGCDLQSDMGYMEGYYTFKNMETGEEFIAKIPRFDLIYTGRLN
jgi:ApaG protein